MQSFSFVILASVALVSSARDGHPIESVISLLKDLSGKIENEAKTEEVTYTKFEHWCASSVKTLDSAVAEEKEQIEVLTDTISAKTAQVQTLTQQIAGLETEIGELDASGAAADEMRRKGAAADADAQADYDGTIQAIKDALTAMEGAQSSTDVGLLAARQHVQKALTLAGLSLSDTQRGVLQGFVQTGGVSYGSEEPLSGEPAPAAARPDLKAEGDYGEHVKEYSFKSGSVIELLKGLLTKFEDEKLAAEKAETNSLNAHSLTSDARANAKTAAETSKSEKTTQLGAVEGEKSAAEAELTETQSDLDADTATLGATHKQCALKQSEWAERTAIRKTEQEAMTSAIAILSKVAGVRTEAPSNPVPPPSPVALIEITNDADPRARVVQLLRKEAHDAHSKALERLAQEISAHRDSPFDVVNNMIQKMIFRLQAEQTDEDTHKNWCDQEMSKSNSSKVNKEDKIAMLSTKIDSATASVALLAEEIQQNAEMLATIEQHTAEATEIRGLGKTENAVSIKDAEDAQSALAEAVAVLEAFYKESGMVKKEAWEFVQQPVDLGEEPSTWGASYTGVADPANQPDGILTLLKEVASQFARMQADTQAQEETDQSQFEEDMKDCDIEKARRTKESEMKDAEKKRLTDKVGTMTKTRKATAGELEAVEQYIKDLQPACVDGDSSYDQRKADRLKEIDALHEAQGILGNAFAAPAAAPSAAFLAPVQRAQ